MDLDPCWWPLSRMRNFVKQLVEKFSAKNLWKYFFDFETKLAKDKLGNSSMCACVVVGLRWEEFVDLEEFRNCWRKVYGVQLRIKSWFDELYNGHLVEERAWIEVVRRKKRKNLWCSRTVWTVAQEREGE